MVELRRFIPLLFAFALAATNSQVLLAQSLPDVPSEISFAGVTVYLSEPGRAQVRQEIKEIYANRRQLEQDMDALRQLTPLWQPYLTEANLPIDFRYIALPFTGSEAPVYWAVRPQQIANLRLRVDDIIDERLHPLVATEAVVRYLKRLQEVYHTNPVQTLQYYLQSDVPRYIVEPTAKGGTQTIPLDANSPSLLWKILARKLSVEREDPAYRPATAYVLYAYRNGGGQMLADIARQLNLVPDRFRPYNYWLKGVAIPPDNDYPVLVRLTPDEFPAVRAAAAINLTQPSLQPNDTGFPVLRKLKTQEQGLRSTAVLYSINELEGIQAQPCDNLITLAFYGDIPIKAFLAYNELSEHDVIRPGEIYYLEKKAKRAKVPFHVVQRNQTLRDVSNMYGVQLASLLRFNDIQPTQRIRTGRILWLQNKRPRNRPVEYQQVPVEETAPVLPTPEITKTNVQPAPVDTVTRPAAPPLIKPQPTPVVDSTQIVKAALVAAKPAEQAAVPLIPLSQPDGAVRIHVVKPGQTYYAIARLYGVTPKQLYIWNNLSEQIPLEIGQELVVAPNQKRITAPTSKPILKATPTQPVHAYIPERDVTVRYHVVKPGQTVYRVALINGVTVDEVLRWNNLKNFTIEVGQRLIIRKPK